MPATYTAYYNLVEAEKNQSQSSSRRASEESKDSKASKSSKFSVKNALDQLRPTREVLTPAGIYTPIIKRGSLFTHKPYAEKTKA